MDDEKRKKKPKGSAAPASKQARPANAYCDRGHTRTILYQISTTISCQRILAYPVTLEISIPAVVNMLKSLQAANPNDVFYVSFDLRFTYIHNQHDKSLPKIDLYASMEIDEFVYRNKVDENWALDYIVDKIHERVEAFIGEKYWVDTAEDEDIVRR